MILFIRFLQYPKIYLKNNYIYTIMFQKQLFINAGINTAHRNFLEWFTETAMFTTFINDRIQNGIDDKDVFERRCVEFSFELAQIKRKSKPLQSMKALSDRIKDWAVS